MLFGLPEPPAHCHNCGEGYPWKDKLQDIQKEKNLKAKKPRGKKMGDEDEGRTIHVYHGQVIQGRDFINSPVQQASPNATQNVTFSSDQLAVAKEAIRLVLELLDELALDQAGKDEVRADAESVQKQLDSPKPKQGIVKTLLTGVRDKVTSGIAGKVADYVVENAKTALRACPIRG